MIGRRDVCPRKWCNEVGDHTVHRQYVTSLPAWRGSWLIGVNVSQPAGGSVGVELTATTRRDAALVIRLEPGEAVTVGEALVDAGQRADKAAAST